MYRSRRGLSEGFRVLFQEQMTIWFRSQWHGEGGGTMPGGQGQDSVRADSPASHPPGRGGVGRAGSSSECGQPQACLRGRLWGRVPGRHGRAQPCQSGPLGLGCRADTGCPPGPAWPGGGGSLTNITFHLVSPKVVVLQSSSRGSCGRYLRLLSPKGAAPGGHPSPRLAFTRCVMPSHTHAARDAQPPWPSRPRASQRVSEDVPSRPMVLNLSNVATL